MRTKFIFAILFASMLVLGAAFLLKRHMERQSPDPNSTASAISASPMVSTPAMTVVSNKPAYQPHPTPVMLPPAVNAPSSGTNRADLDADAEVDRLYALSLKDDPASLSNILAALTDPNSEIRAAAIEAAKQFGSTNAIPALKAAVDATDDIQDKIAYLEAVDFLNTPAFDPNEKVDNTPKTPEQIQREQIKQSSRDTRHNAKQQQSPDQNSQSAN